MRVWASKENSSDATSLGPGESTTAAADVRVAPGQWRFLILVMLSVYINFIDRGNLSAAAPVLASDLFLSPTSLGVLLSAFGWTYAFSLPIAGWLVDRYDVKWVFAAGFFIWSVATLGTGWVQMFHTLFFLRLLLGMGEAVAYPSYSKIVASRFPEERRGFVNSLLDTGGKMGPGLGTLIGGLMVARFGWRAMFWTLGTASLVWLIPWLIWAPQQKTARSAEKGGPGVLQIITRRSAWGTFLGHFCANYAMYFLLAWLPTYLVRERHYSMNVMAIWGSVPYLASGATTLLAGWLSDRWIARGSSPTLVRKGFVIASLALYNLTLPIPFVSNEVVAMGLLTLALLGLGFFGANMWAITQTLAGPEAAGRWTGIQNSVSNFSAIIAPLLTGIIVSKTGSFVLAFVAASLMTLCGIGCYLFLVGRVEHVPWKPRIAVPD
jgi:ACS family D-galactonate transporter-like MFS transporter